MSAMTRLTIALLALSLALPAHAQPKKPLAPLAARGTDNLGFPCDFLNLKPGCRFQAAATPADAKPLDVFQKLAAAEIPDLAYASALAKSDGRATATVRAQCYDALLVAKQRLVGGDLKGPDGIVLTQPDPHLFVDAERFAQMVDNLDLKGPVAASCLGAAAQVKASIWQFVSALLTGATGLAALGGT